MSLRTASLTLFIVVLLALAGCRDVEEIIDDYIDRYLTQENIDSVLDQVDQAANYFAAHYYVSVCGDELCAPDYESSWCVDCAGAAYMLDGYCEPGEADYSPDCNGAVCGDGQCTHGEWNECPADCPLSCGDGTCTDLERMNQLCDEDCDEGWYGDGFCGEDEYPWARTDCGLDPRGPGNGVCERDEFLIAEDGSFVPFDRDCLYGYCGDGTCVDGETYCEIDCNPCALDESRPQNCGDGCYSESVDCSSASFSCGGVEHRCRSLDYYAGCHGGEFKQCATWAPYYCAATGGCVDNPADCYIDYDRQCPPWLPYLCVPGPDQTWGDGTCRASAEECTPESTFTQFVGLPCAG